MKKQLTQLLAAVAICASLFGCADDKKETSAKATTTTTEASGKFVAAATNSTSSAEQKLDDFMTAYVNGMNEILAEKNDDAAIAKINAMDAELTPSAKQVAPQIQTWVNNMSESDRKAFEERMAEKPYFKAMLELMFDQRLTTRMEKNPKFKEAFDRMNEKTSSVMNEVEKKDKE